MIYQNTQTMPTAMEYAINKIIELSTELAKYKTRHHEDLNEVIGFHHQDPDCDGIDEEVIEETADERFDKLAKSADLIAEAQEKRIRLLEEDKRERMEDRDRLVKELEKEREDKAEAHRVWTEHRGRLLEEINTYKIQLHQLSDIMLRDKKKKPELSPCMGDPISINGTLQP